MATKMFCDGCDKQIHRPDDVRRVEVSVSRPAMADMKLAFDLCPGCEGHFKHGCLPNAWPRAAPSTEKAAA